MTVEKIRQRRPMRRTPARDAAAGRRMRVEAPPLVPADPLPAPIFGRAAGIVGLLALTGVAWATAASPLVTLPLAAGGLAASVLLLRERMRAGALAAELDRRIARSREEVERLADRMWELQESEQRFHGLIDALGDIVVHRDRDGAIVFANGVVADMLGEEPDALIGRRLLELGIDVGIVPDSAFGDGECLSSTDVAIRTASGLRWFSWVELSVREASGGVTHRAIGRDITARKRAEVALIGARERAEAANKAKSRFLATVSHEIRTPMNGIMGMAKLLADTPLSPEQRTYVGAVSTSASAMLALIEDLLDFSKIEVGRLELEPQQLELRELVENVVELLAPRAFGKGIGLGCCIAADVPQAITADPGRLRQVLLNIVGNAVKFTETGGVLVEVERCEEDGASFIRFRVADTGPGIGREDLARIFEEFEQADGSSTRRHGGAGLGLTISRRIVDAMDGRLTASGARGEGAVFTLDIPARDMVERPLDRSAALSGRSLLILSRNEMEAAAIARIVEGHGGDAFVARTVEEAAAGEASGRKPFDTVLVDAELERADGRLLKRMRQSGIDVRDAVTLIAPTDRSRLAEYRASGYDTFLVRPVRGETLLRVTLPAGDGLAPRAGPDAVPGATREARTRRRGLQILIAEDNEINALLARSALEKAGHNVRVVGNGRAAVELLTGSGGLHRYDIVLMDLHMPQMDGLDAISAIRKYEEQKGVVPVPIIVLSADGQEATRHGVMAHGASGFLAKPVDPEAMIETVEREAQS